MNIPEGHQAVMPYLIVEGAVDFLAFTQKVFNAELIFKQMRDEKTMMHAEIKVGNSTIMFTDATDQFPAHTAGLFVYVDNADDAFQKAVLEGATIIMDLSDQDYGRTCGIKDPVGNVWWITSVKN